MGWRPWMLLAKAMDIYLLWIVNIRTKNPRKEKVAVLNCSLTLKMILIR